MCDWMDEEFNLFLFFCILVNTTIVRHFLALEFQTSWFFSEIGLNIFGYIKGNSTWFYEKPASPA